MLGSFHAECQHRLSILFWVPATYIQKNIHMTHTQTNICVYIYIYIHLLMYLYMFLYSCKCLYYIYVSPTIPKPIPSHPLQSFPLASLWAELHSLDPRAEAQTLLSGRFVLKSPIGGLKRGFIIICGC